MAWKRGQSGNPTGRPSFRPKFADYITEAEIKTLVNTAKKQASMKPELLKFVLEQVFGKPPQSFELPGESGELVFKWRKEK